MSCLTMWHGRPAGSHVCCRSCMLQWLLCFLCLDPHRCNMSTDTQPGKNTWTYTHTHNDLNTYFLIRRICQVSHLVVTLMRHRLKDNRLHCWHICKLHLRYVKSTYYMGPPCNDMTIYYNPHFHSKDEPVAKTQLMCDEKSTVSWPVSQLFSFYSAINVTVQVWNTVEAQKNTAREIHTIRKKQHVYFLGVCRVKLFSKIIIPLFNMVQCCW